MWNPFKKDRKGAEPPASQGRGTGEITGFGASSFPQAGFAPVGLGGLAKRRLNSSPIRLARKIGDILYAAGRISEEDLAEGLRIADREGMLLGRALISLGRIKESELLHCLDQQKLVTSVDIGRLKIPEHVIAKVPETLAHKYGIVPFDIVGELLCVCAKSPLSFESVKAVRDRTRMRVRAFDSQEGWASLRDCIEIYYPVAKPMP